MPDPYGKKLCFVVGPIGDEGTDVRIHADWLLEGIIKPVLANFPEFDVKRADHDARPGLIDVQMINALLNAELVIADLSLLNPNAFYEIGIRHMAQKPIIHMQLAAEKPPFDVSLYRAIRFARAQFSDLGKAQDELKRSVEAVLAPDYQPENPVTNARGHLNLEQNATPEIRVLMDEIEGIKSRLDTMQTYLLPPTPPSIWVATADDAVFTNRQRAAVASTAAAVAKASAAGIGSTPPASDTTETSK